MSVTPDQTFLDLLLTQVEGLHSKHDFDIPLYFMNSFHTSSETRAAMRPDMAYQEIIQHQFPRLSAETKGAIRFAESPELEWHPPGHGDLFFALIASGMIDQFGFKVRARKVCRGRHKETHVRVFSGQNIGGIQHWSRKLLYFAQAATGQ